MKTYPSLKITTNKNAKPPVLTEQYLNEQIKAMSHQPDRVILVSKSVYDIFFKPKKRAEK